MTQDIFKKLLSPLIRFANFETEFYFDLKIQLYFFFRHIKIPESFLQNSSKCVWVSKPAVFISKTLINVAWLGVVEVILVDDVLVEVVATNVSSLTLNVIIYLNSVFIATCDWFRNGKVSVIAGLGSWKAICHNYWW